MRALLMGPLSSERMDTSITTYFSLVEQHFSFHPSLNMFSTTNVNERAVSTVNRVLEVVSIKLNEPAT